ncbi:CoA transferase [Polaromonas sp. P1-6]|nr:CoA transferase [Polaromonas sp. P1-6]
MSTPSDRRPLEGVRVVDWTHVLAGPFAGYQLGLLGADVIRIERTDADEMIRATAVDPELARLGLGETFVGQAGGKRSLALDAKNPLAREALRRLIADADVLLENFRPGKLAQLGFDPAELIRNYPQLVVCSITGFGPGSDRRAYDHVVQGASGLMAANANGQGVPQRVGFPLVDYAVGQQAAFAVMAALYRRDTGRETTRTSGEWLQVTMANAALTLMAPAYVETLVSGQARPRSASTAFSGSPVSGTFQVADGWLAIVCNAKVQTEGLFSGLQEGGAEFEPLRACEQRSNPRQWIRHSNSWPVSFLAERVPTGNGGSRGGECL